ncbi:MAG: twin-arginine translocase subunit TatB [Alphaproteobacteria bacterium]|nr:twin-arginine translocase subunit TatB [Alphaproteobacteria bacterium]
MFDIGWQEIFIIAVLALIVVGPKDLPKVIRTATQVIRKMRTMAAEVQAGLNEVAREAELDEVKKKLTEDTDFKKELEDAVGVDIAESLDLTRDEADKIIGGKTQNVDVTEVFEPRDGSDETGVGPAAPKTDPALVDEDVMPIASAPAVPAANKSEA